MLDNIFFSSREYWFSQIFKCTSHFSGSL